MSETGVVQKFRIAENFLRCLIGNMVDEAERISGDGADGATNPIAALFGLLLLLVVGAVVFLLFWIVKWTRILHTQTIKLFPTKKAGKDGKA